MDTWDSETGEPIIYHGNTLTSKISTRKVCTVIKKYAFVTSPYPVILSIENRCSDSQIPALALIFREEFGGNYFYICFDKLLMKRSKILFCYRRKIFKFHLSLPQT